MGEANRRKKLDPSYGVPTFETKLSKITGKKIITMDFQSNEMPISAHVNPESLELGLSQCQRCLATIPKERWQNNSDKAFDEFMTRLTTDYSYPDEDEMVGIFQDGSVDSSLQSRNEITAEANIKNIKSESNRIFTEPLTDFDNEER